MATTSSPTGNETRHSVELPHEAYGLYATTAGDRGVAEEAEDAVCTCAPYAIPRGPSEASV